MAAPHPDGTPPRTKIKSHKVTIYGCSTSASVGSEARLLEHVWDFDFQRDNSGRVCADRATFNREASANALTPVALATVL